MRDSVVFYRSFYEAMRNLEPDVYKETMNAVLAYAMDEKISELSPVANAIFTMAKPQIDANNRKFEAGCKGGRPKKPIDNQEETNGKPNHNPMRNVNVNENVNVNNNRQKNKFNSFPQKDLDMEALKQKVFING